MKTAKRFAMLAGLALALMAVLSFAGCNGKGGSAKAAPESDFEFKLSDDGTFIAITNYKGDAKNLVIPETIQGVPVASIGGFYYNKKIKSVVIPSSVKVIRAEAFSECEALEKVTLPEGLLFIDGGAFSETALTSVTVPKSLLFIGRGAFGSDNLSEINIPDDAAFIGTNEYAELSEAFSGNKIDSSVELQKKLKGIKQNYSWREDFLKEHEELWKYL
ncbi:MAG: leucine-rich repeat domain-containing protein [Spirochaetaceae bacterium]|nr:leucine-rich repeat domain-containing protein [Spirochaetaceae bacterium]